MSRIAGKALSGAYRRMGSPPRRAELIEKRDGSRVARGRRAVSHPVVEAVETPFGLRYVVEGELPAPDGRAPGVRAVWFVRHGP